MQKYKKIYVEITNSCNLSCSFCPKTERKIKFIKLEQFEKTIDEIKNLTEEVCLHILGDPLLHPKFKAIMEICDHKKVQINLTTNGILLKKQKDVIINSKSLKQVNISLHSLPDNLEYEKAKEQIINIINTIKEIHKTRPKLFINYRVWNLDEKDEEKTKLILETLKNQYNTKINPDDVKKSEKIRIAPMTKLTFDEIFEWPKIVKKSSHNEKHIGFCHGLKTHFGILVDGTVVPCCLDYDGIINLGNINEKPIIDILNSKRAKTIKQSFCRHKLEEELCKNCGYINRFKR